MPTPLVLPSFAAGELSPALHGRVDLAKYSGRPRDLPQLVHPSLRRRLDAGRDRLRRRVLRSCGAQPAGPVLVLGRADLRAGVRRPEDARHHGRRLRARKRAGDLRHHQGQPRRRDGQRTRLLERRSRLARWHRRHDAAQPPARHRGGRDGQHVHHRHRHHELHDLRLGRHGGAVLHRHHALRDGRSGAAEVRAERGHHDA